MFSKFSSVIYFTFLSALLILHLNFLLVLVMIPSFGHIELYNAPPSRDIMHPLSGLSGYNTQILAGDLISYGYKETNI